jgi:valyl-tRNA synthetase
MTKITNQIESNVSKKWQELNVYGFDKNNDTAKKFYIDTPPPTVSGFLHMGHVFSYVQADIIARYKRMQGFNVFYPIGFDDNGLPTERLVEKLIETKVGFKYKESSLKTIAQLLQGWQPDSETCTEEDFLKICKKVVEEAEGEFKNLFETIALSVDWDLKYQTISEKTAKISQDSFIDLYNKGLIYKKHAPVYWDCVDKTALAQADLEDKELDSFENTIIFTQQSSGTKFEIMTTRPEMLSACLCVFYHPDDTRYNNLKNTNLMVPLAGHLVPLLADDDVKIDKGTGLVMCCSYGDWQDVLWVKRHNLKPKLIISDDGKIDGIKIDEARKNATKSLEEQGLLKDKKQIKHPVKCAERSGKPIEILEKEQWYLSVLPFKQKLLDVAQKLNFHPEYMKQRLLQWTAGLNQDWCISRDRFFGIKIPVRYLTRHENGEKTELRDISVAISDKLAKQNSATIVSELKDKYDDAFYSLEQYNGVLDTWFTSSISPAVAFGDIKNTPVFDIRPQAHEIIRTWAFYTMVKSYLHSVKLKNGKSLSAKQVSEQNFNPDEYFAESEINIPWFNLVISGWCLAADKTKMSKSKGNVVTPLELIKNRGVDCIRFWCANSSLGADVAYSDQLLDKGGKFVTKLSNVISFALQKLELTNSIISNKKQEQSLSLVTEVFDIFVLKNLEALVGSYKQELDRFEYFKARMLVDDFFWNLLCDNYLEIIKIRYYGKDALIYKDKTLSTDELDDITKKQTSCLVTLNIICTTLLKLYAPYTPYACEHLYQLLQSKNIDTISKEESIHWTSSFSQGFVCNLEMPLKAKTQCLAMLDIISDVRKFKSINKLALNSQLDSFEIKAKDGMNQENDISLVLQDLKNVTGVMYYIFK